MADHLMKRYEFSDFAEWAGTVNASIEDFTESFGIHPNIMCAGSSVWQAINEAVRNEAQNVVNAEGEHPGPGDVVELAGFYYGDECHLTFTVNEVTPYPAFLLVFDEDPSFDGEPELVGEDEETVVAAVPYAL